VLKTGCGIFATGSAFAARLLSKEARRDSDCHPPPPDRGSVAILVSVNSNSEMQRFESRLIGGESSRIPILKCGGSNPPPSTGQSVSNAYGIRSLSRSRRKPLLRRAV